jgi:ribosomal protein S18 acetylase RimI-like enzyme
VWAALAARVLGVAARCTPRVRVERWVRYRAGVPSAEPAVPPCALTRFDDAVVTQLRAHADATEPAFSSGLAFWAHELRGGYVWLEDGQPLCSQWLFTERDNRALRLLPEWAGMYPPLAPGTGQLEKLWTFSSARRRGVASQFAELMFAEAQRAGLQSLRTHIHESNVAARRWAQRTGWEPFGTIERFVFDVPGLRDPEMAICVHRSGPVPDMPAPAPPAM